MTKQISEQTILITGATDGLGKETARKLAALGARLILHGRNKAKLQSVVSALTAEFPDARVDTILADFSSLAQVRAMAAEINQRFDRLDILVNNAGVMPSGRQLSQDGYELAFAVNYLATFLLTNLLLPLLKRSAPARVINLSSVSHKLLLVNPNLIDKHPGYIGWMNYARAKLLLTAFTFALGRRVQSSGISCLALHPGIIVGTKVNSVRWLRSQTTREEGADTMVNCCVNPAFENIGGAYISIDRVAKANPQARSVRFQELVWEKSLKWCGLSGPGSDRFNRQPTAVKELCSQHNKL